MFQTLVVNIAEKLNNIKENKKSIIQTDIQDLKEKIQETLFTIDFNQDTINEQNFPQLEELNITNKQALGLFFLMYTTTLRDDLSYSYLWVSGIADELMDDTYKNNQFFIENYFIDDAKPNTYLNEAIKEAINRFDLRDGFDEDEPSHTVLLHMGLLKRFKHLNLWLTSNSKQPIIKELTDKTNKNYSPSFNEGWKVLQKYSRFLIDKTQTIKLLKQNVWFKDFDLDDLLKVAKTTLSSPFITKDEIENNFFLSSVKFENEKLIFILDGDDFDTLNLKEDEYDIFIDNQLESKLLKNTDDMYDLENPIEIIEAQNSNIFIEIKDKTNNIVYKQEFILFDFNHDILIFDEEGNFYKDKNDLLDDSKNYNVLIDSDFESNTQEETFEYFDGYVQLIPNITKDSKLELDDGEEYKFSLNFEKTIKTPSWINHLELFGQKEVFEFNEELEYKLKYNKLSTSIKKVDELVDITKEAKIVRWNTCDGMVYDYDDETFSAKIELSEEMLLNKIHSLVIEFENQTYTKRFNTTLIEQSQKPIYRTFLKNENNEITFLAKDSDLGSNEIKNAQFICLCFHKDILSNPQDKQKILRDKSLIFDNFELNKFFTIKNYAHYGEELSAVSKIYDDVRWNKICAIRKEGIVKKISEDKTLINLDIDDSKTKLKLITLDINYEINICEVQIQNKQIKIANDILGFSLLEDSKYLGSHFFTTDIDVQKVFSDVTILKFLRFSYFPFADFFNEAKLHENRVLREKARNDKKKIKKTLRQTVLANTNIFLSAFLEDELELEDLKLHLNFEHSKIITEQMLFAIVFDENKAKEILYDIILNRWQEKLINLPIFLVYLLNKTKDERYINIFLDELPQDINKPQNEDEEFTKRILTSLLGNHKISGFEKINVKTITQREDKYYYLQKALNACFKPEPTIIEENLEQE